MSDIKSIVELRTGDPDFDIRLEKAFVLGQQHGRVRSFEDYKLDLTRTYLLHIMRKCNLSLAAAMKVLEIPKSDRKSYTAYFEKSKKLKDMY